MSLAIIIPTVGRSSLLATLESVAGQVTSTDHVIVVADLPEGGARDEASKRVRAQARGSQARWQSGWPTSPLGAWGHGARNFALDRLGDATHVCTIDDDDVYLPGALHAIRERGCRDKPVVFKARWGSAHPAAGVTLWHRREVAYGNVATPMVVWPAASAARWGLRYGGDFDMFVALEREYGELYWDEQEIAEVRPVAVEAAA